MILTLITLLLLFIPGILLLIYATGRGAHKLDMVEYVLYGSVLWNYMFISLSILIGLFSNFFREFYTVFAFLSFLAIIVGIGLNLRIFRRPISFKESIKIQIKIIPKIKLKLLVIVIILLFLTINLLFLNYHSIIYEWDAIYYYVPIAKSLVISGHLSNVLRDLNFVEHSPAIPIFYSFILHFDENIENLYLVPSVFFILTALAILELAKTMKFRNASFIAVLVFINSPSVQIVLGSRALYLDLPFLFYFTTSLLLITKMAEDDNKSIEEFLLPLSLTLLFLTRIEVSLFILPALFVAYLLPSNIGARADLPLAFFTMFSVPIL